MRTARLAPLGQIGQITAIACIGKLSMTFRAVDHCVLPVESLATARTRYMALGFTVAPDAIHPFGTENACVFFADGTYLEPLGIAQREECEATAAKGNVFTARDQAYRFRNGQDGFSAIAFKSDNADRDHRLFEALGVSAGKKLLFGRTMFGADGRSGRATFKNAFAGDLRSPDCFFFACQRVRMPDVDRTAQMRHDNGTTGIAKIVASEANPTDFQYVLQMLTGNRETHADSFTMEIATANCLIEVCSPDGLAAYYGVKRTSQDRGLRLEGLVLNRDGGTLPTGLRRHGGYSIANKAAGQGAFIAFAD